MMENWMWWKEQLFIKCDKATREQGRIVKAVIVEDMKGIKQFISSVHTLTSA